MHLNLCLANTAIAAALLLASTASAKPMDIINSLIRRPSPMEPYEGYQIGKLGAFENPKLMIIRVVAKSEMADYIHAKLDNDDLTITCVPKQNQQTNPVVKLSEQFSLTPQSANVKMATESNSLHTRILNKPACVHTYDEFLKKVGPFDEENYHSQWAITSKAIKQLESVCFDANNDLALVRFDKLIPVSEQNIPRLYEVDQSVTKVMHRLHNYDGSGYDGDNAYIAAAKMIASLVYAPPTYQGSGAAPPNYGPSVEALPRYSPPGSPRQ
ncbi:hypothetical protein BDF22DRAFT_746903 [Syncephalis plumigaleata]|nr:hypothetical protein BDF22DRAFT_746903 [Syncephalis plumigaleata]